jgi:tetratricopeptide (TPR) repeat protein
VRQTLLSIPLALSLSLATFAVTSTALCQPAEDPARVEEARTRYREGLQFFQRRQFPEATVAFERSFRIRPHPFTLYNAAEARMRAGDPQGALQQLRDLLAMTTPAPEADLVQRARALAQQMGEQNLQPTPQESHECPTCPACAAAPECPAPPPPMRTTTQISPAAWGLAGASLALVGVGAGFLAVAVDNSNTYADPLAPRVLQEQLRDQGETYRIIGVVGLAAGVGAAVGAVWMFTHPRHVEEPTSVARVRFDVGPSSLSLSGTF